jgi:hypothetical protein
MSVDGLLLVSAIAILLHKRAGIAAGFVGQALLLPPFLRDMVYGVGSFLFTGSGYSGVDPSYTDLAFTFLALVVVVGPALTVLLLMSMRTTTGRRGPSRVAATLLAVQTAILVVVALVVFRATLHDCSYYGADPPTIDGVPDCTDLAHMDIGSVIGTILPSAAVLLLVSIGVWRCRGWAIVGGIVWQVLLAVALTGMAVALWTEPSQNAWYDHFPVWTSPRYLAYALMIIFPVPTLAGLLASQTNRTHSLVPSQGVA